MGTRKKYWLLKRAKSIWEQASVAPFLRAGKLKAHKCTFRPWCGLLPATYWKHCASPSQPWLYIPVMTSGWSGSGACLGCGPAQLPARGCSPYFLTLSPQIFVSINKISSQGSPGSTAAGLSALRKNWDIHAVFFKEGDELSMRGVYHVFLRLEETLTPHSSYGLQPKIEEILLLSISYGFHSQWRLQGAQVPLEEKGTLRQQQLRYKCIWRVKATALGSDISTSRDTLLKSKQQPQLSPLLGLTLKNNQNSLLKAPTCWTLRKARLHDFFPRHQWDTSRPGGFQPLAEVLTQCRRRMK